MPCATLRGRHLAHLGQLDQEVAAVLHEARKALGLVAHDKHDLALQVAFPNGTFRMLAGARNPEPVLLEAFHGLHEIGHLRHGQMRNGAGRAFVRGRRHAGGALVRYDDAGGPHRFRAARDGAQIARVGDVVEHDHERSPPVLGGAALGRLQDGRHVDVAERDGLGHDPLMAPPFRKVVEPFARHRFHRHVETARLAQDVFDEGVSFRVVGQKHALHRHVGAQRFDDGAFAPLCSLPCFRFRSMRARCTGNQCITEAWLPAARDPMPPRNPRVRTPRRRGSTRQGIPQGSPPARANGRSPPCCA